MFLLVPEVVGAHELIGQIAGAVIEAVGALTVVDVRRASEWNRQLLISHCTFPEGSPITGRETCLMMMAPFPNS
jgi:hypothetical protein